MDFLTLAKKRYSVRAYTKQKVEKEKLDAILEAAHVAPTGGNCQLFPFSYFVGTSGEICQP